MTTNYERWLSIAPPGKQVIRLLCGRDGKVLARAVPAVHRIPEGQPQFVLEVPEGLRQITPWIAEQAHEVGLDLDPDDVGRWEQTTPGPGERTNREVIHDPTSTWRYRLQCKCGATPVVNGLHLGSRWLDELEQHGSCTRLVIGAGSYATAEGIRHL